MKIEVESEETGFAAIVLVAASLFFFVIPSCIADREANRQLEREQLEFKKSMYDAKPK